MQKFSSSGRKKKQTKIRHRMVMLRHLQLLLIVIRGGLCHKPGGFSRSPRQVDGVNFSLMLKYYGK